MNFLQKLKDDDRLHFLEEVTVLIDARLTKITTELESSGWYDGNQASDDAEPLLGLGLVALQNYAAATIEDLKRTMMRDGKSVTQAGFKDKCYAQDPFVVSGPRVKERVTGMQLINAGANYFKHHDEWGQRWPTEGTGKETVEVLRRAGITAQTEFPCIEVVTLLCGTCWKMFGLLPRIKQWQDILAQAQ